MNVTLNQLGGELFSRLGQLSVELALLAALVLLASRLLAAVWAAGVALLLGRMLVGYGVIWKLRRRARVYSTGYLFNVLQQARRALQVNAYIGVATSAVVRSPIVMGIFRPLIVIPAELLDKLRADELELVLIHELAHVRRLDNLTLLLQRLVAAVLFFHPAVWLCGRMLQREAEQACDDLVVNATDRSQTYACGLTRVAELAHLKSHLKRRIPMLNVFAAAESDLALRIRRTLHGGASRMGTRSRVLAGLMLFALAALTLPGAVIAQTSDDGVDWWDTAKTTAPEEWSQELKDQIVAAGYDVEKIAERVRGQGARERAAGEGDRETHDADLDAIGLKIREAIERGEITPEEGREKWQAVQRQAGEKRGEGAIDLDAIGLKIREAVANGDITAEEGREKMEAARRRAAGDEGKPRAERVWRAAMATDPDEWSEELKAAILELMPDSTIEEIAEGIRQRQALVESKRGADGDRLRDFRRGVIERAMAETPDEWSDELKAAIKRAGWDLQEFSEGIRQRQAAGSTVTDFSQILIDLATSVEETSWGQVKKEVKEVDEDK